MRNDNLVLMAQFCLHHRLAPSFMVSLHEFGLIRIVELNEEHFLHIDELNKAEKIVRLHHELGINFEGIDVINTLLQQIETLQYELAASKNRLETFAPNLSSDDNNQLNC
ncbi:chaperone modulator CbpM [Pedobacter sp. SL55]|uniref:chaperone modulator CbpM n=1 Tax=Pedobacter sp. SL55 TaxID=2995161 RepID=UPI00227227AC|nr:chaperone modulator CbpM [Pedobacter sp. SL55]WAC39409.1 chaperone modulator CbpM [Pedobacter sp. SL55]